MGSRIHPRECWINTLVMPYECDNKKRWHNGFKKYLDKAIRRIEIIIVEYLPKKDTLMLDGDHLALLC